MGLGPERTDGGLAAGAARGTGATVSRGAEDGLVGNLGRATAGAGTSCGPELGRRQLGGRPAGVTGLVSLGRRRKPEGAAFLSMPTVGVPILSAAAAEAALTQGGAGRLAGPLLEEPRGPRREVGSLLARRTALLEEASRGGTYVLASRSRKAVHLLFRWARDSTAAAAALSGSG